MLAMNVCLILSNIFCIRWYNYMSFLLCNAYVVNNINFQVLSQLHTSKINFSYDIKLVSYVTGFILQIFYLFISMTMREVSFWSFCLLVSLSSFDAKFWWPHEKGWQMFHLYTLEILWINHLCFSHK